MPRLRKRGGFSGRGAAAIDSDLAKDMVCFSGVVSRLTLHDWIIHWRSDCYESVDIWLFHNALSSRKITCPVVTFFLFRIHIRRPAKHSMKGMC
jgi:hypothetical protein